MAGELWRREKYLTRNADVWDASLGDVYDGPVVGWPNEPGTILASSFQTTLVPNSSST
jgi:hypothetical protein